MRRIIAVILALCATTLLLPACGIQSDAPPVGNDPSASPATAADFTDTDFSGHWAISQVFDSQGAEVSADKLAKLEGFTLELLPDGTYFVYDEEGIVLGPGRYKVEKDNLILEAKDVQTIYTVADVNTLRGATVDGCITVLTRQPEPAPTSDEQGPDEGEDETGEPQDGEDISEEGSALDEPSTEAA